jgi:hypothetical protein
MQHGEALSVSRGIVTHGTWTFFNNHNHNNKDNQPMIQHTRKLIHIVPTLALMLSGADAIAREPVGTITYGPLQSIPALSGSMLMVLGLLFAVLAFRALRAHSASKPLASIVAVGILVLGAASGNQLIQNAWAGPTGPTGFTNPSGGVITVLTPDVEHKLDNTSGQPQRVISVTPGGSFVIVTPTTGQPQCTPGLTVQNSSFCYINFTSALG